jgi:hypothetical protein
MAPDEQLQRMQVVRSAVAHGEISQEKGQQKVEQIVDAGTPKGVAATTQQLANLYFPVPPAFK